MSLSHLNSITATVVACMNCGLTTERIATKLVAKYGIPSRTATALVLAIQDLEMAGVA